MYVSTASSHYVACSKSTHGVFFRAPAAWTVKAGKLAAGAVCLATLEHAVVLAAADCQGSGLVSGDVWAMARKVDEIVQFAHVPRELTRAVFDAFFGITRAGALEEVLADCPLGMATLIAHSIPEFERRFGLKAAADQFAIYQRIVHDHSDNLNASGYRWSLETHQSPSYPFLLGLGTRTCYDSSLKVFVYETEFAARPLECSQGMFASEVFVHRFFLHSACRTVDPNEADFFFVPVYAACVMTKDNRKAADMDEFYKTLVSERLPHFSRRDGRDHIFLWSSETYDFPSWRDYIGNSPYLSVEAVPIECTDFDFFSEETAANFGEFCQHCSWCFQPWKDMVIPGFVEKWSVAKMHSVQQPFAKRTYTACYHGADSDNLAIYLYANASVRNRLQELRHMPRVSIGYRFGLIKDYFERIGQCHFCFVPKGLGYWSNRLYEVLFAGCIPVILSDEVGLPFDSIVDWGSFSIRWPMAHASPALVAHLEGLLAARRSFVEQLHQNVLRRRCWFDYNSEDPRCSPYLAILIELERRRASMPRWAGRRWHREP